MNNFAFNMTVQSTVDVPIYVFVGSYGWNCWDTPVAGDAWGYVTPSKSISAEFSQKSGHGCDDNPATVTLFAVSSLGQLTMPFTCWGGMTMGQPQWTPLDPAHTQTATFTWTGPQSAVLAISGT
ncbi:MAG: hypothetical protein EON59_14480 [Alphaproteobacteria bacterium]|nr:MAG: hypothetical protein EON59_14480 [Alphaproteobacteria bacterium]